MTPTAEQQAILACPPTETMKVSAFAGCGKTSTLVAYAKTWKRRGLYLAFNSAIAKEASARFPAHVETRTAHAFAYRALDVHRHRDRLVPRLRLENLRPFEDHIAPVPGMTPGQVRSAILRTLETFLSDAGNRVLPEHCGLANRTQRKPVIAMTAKIASKMLNFAKRDHAFTHDIYLKAFELWHAIESRYDYLLLDESQDLNPVIISIIEKAKLPAIIVGDPWQSIYRFRGAVNAMEAFSGPELPLTQSWRFGPEVARLANRILRHSSRPPRRPLRGNPERETEVIRYRGKVGANTAILARTNARLFESLVNISRPFHLVGGLADLSRQVASAHALSRGRFHEVSDASVARFTSWAAFEAAAERGDGEARRLRDIVVAHGDDLPDLLKRLEGLHRIQEAEAQIIVSTAHKAKGREWPSVVILDDFEDPAVLEKRRRSNVDRAAEMDQEVNLLYVACTRATSCLQLAPKLYDALM